MNRSKFDLEGFFPRLRRGHSNSLRPAQRVWNEAKERWDFVPRKVRCSEELCSQNNPKARAKHLDQAANIKDWEEERGISLYDIKLRFTQRWRYQEAA